MKVTFTKDGFTFEEEINKIDDVFEFGSLVKSVLFNLSDDDIKKSLEIYKTAKMCNVSDEGNKTISPVKERATEGQKKYMKKLGIEYTDETTKEEAIDLINEWKKANGIAINEELTKLAKSAFDEK